MDTIRLENFRCFRKKQSARLAPLTLLVGDNSTGKTSFMAMIRALWQLAYELRIPDFKEEPYDLGSFDEITYYQGDDGGQADSFQAGFDAKRKNKEQLTRFDYTFERNGTAPIPVKRNIAHNKTWSEEIFQASQRYIFRVGTNNGSWDVKFPVEPGNWSHIQDSLILPHYSFLMGLDDVEVTPLKTSPSMTKEDIAQINRLSIWPTRTRPSGPFASAPVRSKPQRTYDPRRLAQDPEGDYIPMLLAEKSFYDKDNWEILKKNLEDFGMDAGLFNEITIRQLGEKASDPFQVQIRKFNGSIKGPKHNLVDMGYGVSQVLPIVTELLHETDRPLYLLQQPEVHLHPSAQAALGSLFCQVAGSNRQLVVETHSDHLLDRVRMDIRDGDTLLSPEDVSILFFEREGLDVNIHSIQIDSEGNIVGAPNSYRRFFMEEITRSLWKRRSSAKG